LIPFTADVIGSSRGISEFGVVTLNFIAEIGGGKEGGGILYNIIKYYKIK
jgi:hypothetical protein